MKIDQIVNENMAEDFSTDPELRDKQQFALRHYGNYPKNPGMAFDKWVQRSLMHSEQDDEMNASKIKELETDISNLQKQMNLLSNDSNQGDLKEKSTSQAQFRTMAAAAHNPAFARKVGIDTDVAQEFHGADRGQDYKGLPKKANEAAPTAPDPQNYDSDWDYYNDRDSEEPKDDDADYENMDDAESDDWFDESKEKIGNMDADAFDAALARMKKLAGAGPLRTVYDPARRVYKNVPHAVQPAQQPKKAR
jgi:hypothetical protein